MAYMSQERKTLIAQALKAIPEIREWKYSLSVDGGRGIKLRIMQAPIDLLAVQRTMENYGPTVSYAQINTYHIQNVFEGETLAIMFKIMEALNLYGTEKANWDKSDIQSDYFDVGWYVYVNIGRWDSPFLQVLPASEAPVKASPKKGAAKGLLNLYACYLPDGFNLMTPGKKAAATKAAMKMAGVSA